MIWWAKSAGIPEDDPRILGLSQITGIMSATWQVWVLTSSNRTSALISPRLRLARPLPVTLLRTLVRGVFHRLAIYALLMALPLPDIAVAIGLLAFFWHWVDAVC